MTWTTTLARCAFACALPTLLASGCMVRRVNITENLPTGETRETFVEALESGLDPSILRVEAAVIDGDRLEALILSQPVGCRTCLEQRAQQVTIRRNQLDNSAKWGIPLLYGLGGVTLIPLVEAGDYDRSDWRTYGPVLAVGAGLITVPTANLLSTAQKTTLERKDVWLATEDCRDSPCPSAPTDGAELFLALPAAAGETPPERPCDVHPARCATTGDDGRVPFDLTAAAFADAELAAGTVVLYLQTADETVAFHTFDVSSTPAFGAAAARLQAAADVPDGDPAP
ncbi:MAG: hypothetical protein QGH45_01160 [Myxococcota bacterium]|jgi:hypothetical protein|nr:hypothetical protein [Myxococcota bacterium]